MNEEEWMATTNPQAMLKFYKAKLSDRKLRLFACACCRRIWHLMIDQHSQQAVEAAEMFSDKNVTKEELDAFCRAARQANSEGWKYAGAAARDAARSSIKQHVRDVSRIALIAASRNAMIAEA